jgi:hypothetical protein
LDAARQAGKMTGIEITGHLVARPGADEPLTDLPPHRGQISSLFSPPFPEAHGIGPSGAVLVRPDGYVAWRQRSFSADAPQSLTSALTQVLCR